MSKNEKKYLFDFKQIETIVMKQLSHVKLFKLAPNEEPKAYIDYLLKSKEKNAFRDQCLIDYQDHWFGLDIQKTTPNGALEIVILDAANALNKLAGFLSLTDNITRAFQINYSFTHIASIDKPLQKDSNTCSIFSLEHVKWAAQIENLHQRLSSLVCPVDKEKHVIFSSAFIREKFPHLPKSQLDTMSKLLANVHWLDYERLIACGEEWQQGFFNHDQRIHSETPFSKWIIEASSKRDVVHNIRIHYSEYCMNATLHDLPCMPEDEYIINYICNLYKRTPREIGVVLRQAVASGCILHVKNLLALAEVNVNEVPLSGQTALDRAYSIKDQAIRKEMSDLLLEYKAVSASAFSTSLFTPPSAGRETTIAPASEGSLRP